MGDGEGAPPTSRPHRLTPLHRSHTSRLQQCWDWQHGSLTPARRPPAWATAQTHAASCEMHTLLMQLRFLMRFFLWACNSSPRTSFYFQC